jgi:hypothetical protein
MVLLLATLVAAMSVLAGGRKGDDPPGSSHFGVWFTDRWGLPAYRYTGHPAASSLPTGHAPLVPTVAHQVGHVLPCVAVASFLRSQGGAT